MIFDATIEDSFIVGLFSKLDFPIYMVFRFSKLVPRRRISGFKSFPLKPVLRESYKRGSMKTNCTGPAHCFPPKGTTEIPGICHLNGTRAAPLFWEPLGKEFWEPLGKEESEDNACVERTHLSFSYAKISVSIDQAVRTAQNRKE